MLKGKNNGVLIIAEIGGNHEGNFEYAKRLTQLAINCEVDVVKFQLYTGDSLVNKVIGFDRNAHFKKFELSKKQHIELAKMVLNAGKKYSASVWDLDMMEWIDPYISYYKIGSGDLTAYSILKAIVQRHKPIILSTGLSTEQEVIDCVNYIQSLDTRYKSPEYLAILQCTSMYPIQDSDANLSVIIRFKKLFNLPIGYSDHSVGLNALTYSVVLGADILEFHFTDTRENKTYRDHKVSLIPEEVKQLNSRIKNIYELLGDSVKKPLKIEIDNRHDITFRRGVFVNKNITKGQIIKEDDLVCLRPMEGISARYYQSIIGKRAICDIKQLEPLSFSMFK